MTPWDADAVMRAFGDLTGIFFRVVANDHQRLALKFSQHFTLEELETVLEWTQRQIARPGSKYAQGSLQWRTIMGTLYQDEFVVFQERLGLATAETKRTGWRPKLVLSRAAGAVAPVAAPKPAPVAVSAEEQQRIAETVRRQQADFMAQMGRVS